MRSALMFLCLALLPSACRRPLPETAVTLEGGERARPFRRSNPPGKEPAKPKLPPLPGGELEKSTLSSRLAARKRERSEIEPEEPSITERYRASISTFTPLNHGDRPEEGQPGGRPAVRQPEEEAIAPAGPPGRYQSPAPLHEVRAGKRMPRIHGAEFGEEEEVEALGVAARRPGAAPPQTPILDDSIPALGIADPDVIGSYHVQIASTPAFSKILFNKVYPFMGEVDLGADLAGAPEHIRMLWIRYSVIDLLDFEHPYTRPRRLILRGPGGLRQD